MEIRGIGYEGVATKVTVSVDDFKAQLKPTRELKTGYRVWLEGIYEMQKM